MRYYFYNGKIEIDEFKKLIDFIHANECEQLTIFLDSSGGSQDVMHNMIRVINEHADRITLVVNMAQSAAFLLLFKVKCTISLNYGCMGMIHKSYLKDIYVDEVGKIPYFIDQARIKNMKQICRADADMILSKLTKTEQNKYKRSDDVFFTYERMCELFPQSVPVDITAAKLMEL